MDGLNIDCDFIEWTAIECHEQIQIVVEINVGNATMLIVLWFGVPALTINMAADIVHLWSKQIQCDINMFRTRKYTVKSLI